MNLLIKNGTVLTMDATGQILTPGWVWIEEDRIWQIGEDAPPATLQPDRTIDATGLAVLPGLVNGHTHLSQTFMRGLGDDLPLLKWLKEVMWPLQAAMTPDDMRLASLLGLVENVRCGVTSVGQHHKITTTPDHVEAAAIAAEAIGVRMQLARAWADLGDTDEDPTSIIEATTHLHDRWHNAANGRITIAFGPLVPWRCSEDTMLETFNLAHEWEVPLHIHIAETQAEIEMMQHRTESGSHIVWLYEIYCLDDSLQLVHCVHVNDLDLDLIAEAGAQVIHCPTSNMYLGSGVAPLKAMLGRHIPVALGTDGPASHNSQDILETLKTAALLAKVSTRDATALTPLDALRTVTTAGSHLLKRTDLGRLEPGCKADLTLINLQTARSMPVHRPANAIVYNATGPDVHTVIVDGTMLLDAGHLTMLDETALLIDCQVAAQKLLQRAGMA